MFDTPQEAALKAENARLRAENTYLRQAVESPARKVTPYGVEEDLHVSPGMISDALRLPRLAGVEGALQDGHRWSVMAWHQRLDGGKMSVAYYVDRAADQFDDSVFVNAILPRMHERFIRQLSEAFAHSK